MGLAGLALVVLSVLAAAVYRLTLAGVGGWDDPSGEARGFAGLLLAMGVILALVSVCQTWYRANALVGMRCRQHAMLLGDALVYSFRMRGDPHVHARTVVICMYSCVDHVVYDAESEMIKVYGGIWTGVTPDIERVTPEGQISGIGYYSIPNCLGPGLLDALSRVCTVQRA